MKRYRAVTAAIAATVIGSLATVANAADDKTTIPGAQKVWVTDYSGKPPFKRRALSAAEFARLEEAKAPAAVPAIGEQVRVVNYQGRPPFRRQLVEVDANNVAEFARLEEVEQPRSDNRRRFGAPGKGFYRR